MNRIAVLALALAATGFGLKADSNGKGKACSASTLKGSYAYSVSGVRPGNVQFAAVGKIAFDGKGLVTTTRTLSDGGTIVRNDTGSGIYSVNADCTGSFSINATGLGALNLDFALGDGGDEIRAIVTNPGLVLTLVGTKQ